MARIARVFLALVVFCVVVVAGAVLGGRYYLARWMATPGPLTAPVTVDIPRGTGVDGIAFRLADVGAIDHPLFLRIAARIGDDAKGLQAGEYALEPGMSPADILARLRSGDVVLHPVTVPEGLTVAEVMAIVGNSPVLSGELPPVPGEGTLLPETYMVPRNETRADLVRRMQADMQAVLDKAWAGRQPNLPLNGPEDLLTLASIIEKETSVQAEYPLVAAVFVNRLRKGMPLQTDPTVIFALTEGKGPLGRELTRADLKVEHPYNTYIYPGLPPGPIANPGRLAVEAAVQPADVDYLFFVADGTGGHAFATTLAEHNRNVARWRKVRDQAG
ncbi:MAG: endolytic transglycosylase MltG [Geminicoccaceae bacterium]